MVTENYNHGFDNLLQAINQVKKEGYSIEFVSTENGFRNPENEKTYLPKNIISVEVIRLDSPLSEPDEDSIMYLLKTDDEQQGWISDSYSISADTNLTNHINLIKNNFSEAKK